MFLADGEKEGDAGGEQQDFDEQIVELFEDQLPVGLADFGGQLVGAVFGQGGFGLRVRQAVLHRNAEMRPELIRRAHVSRLHLGRRVKAGARCAEEGRTSALCKLRKKNRI